MDGNEGEELDGCLRVVALEEEHGDYEECCQHGGEKASLFVQRTLVLLRRLIGYARIRGVCQYRPRDPLSCLHHDSESSLE